jgi:hypothetical protein
MGNGASNSGVKGSGIPTLYIYGLSAPARAAWVTAKAAEIPIHLKYIDLFKGEHKTPEFAKVSKMNVHSQNKVGGKNQKK